jgi:hypothetical protein
MKKQILVYLISLALMLTTFSGCKGSGKAGEMDDLVAFCQDVADDALQDCVDDYMAKNPKWPSGRAQGLCESEHVWQNAFLGCLFPPEGVCGNKVVEEQNGENCELPSTLDNTYCSQSTKNCDGVKLGTRDDYGNCDFDCTCYVDEFFDYKCVRGSCGAACDSNDDCDDSNSATSDSCDLSTCTCKNVPVSPPPSPPPSTCGNNIKESGEDCELPNTVNNNYCTQTTEDCDGQKLGTRDSNGNCGTTCHCTSDAFSNYKCVKGKCQAECGSNADCDDQNSGTVDTCNLDTCACENVLPPPTPGPEPTGSTSTP